MKPVLTKADFVRRYAAGEFGNRASTWGTLGEFLASGYTGLVHVRNRVAGAETWYNVPTQKVERVWAQATVKYNPRLLYISAMAPTDQTLLQGEVMRGLWGLELLCTTIAKPMRDALCERSQRATGILASLILETYLCPNSLDWLTYLLDAYPNHVVEFSCYRIPWGTLPNFNTVFWEVRSY